MYLRPAFVQTDPAAIRALIRANAFPIGHDGVARSGGSAPSDPGRGGNDRSHPAGRRRMIRVWFALLLGLAPAPALADQLVVRIGRIGEVVAPEAGPAEPPRPGNVAGTTPVGDPKFLQLGPEIEGTPCRQFGMEFRAVNLPPGATSQVLVQLTHPLWTRPDGQTGTTETNVSSVSSDRWTYVGYTLEESWSLVPGRWTFTISQGPRVLVTTQFNVTVEPGQTMPADGCSAPTS